MFEQHKKVIRSHQKPRFESHHETIAIIGMGVSGMLVFLRIVEEMVCKQMTNQPLKPLTFIIIEPRVRNSNQPHEAAFYGSYAFSQQNPEIDGVLQANTPPYALPSFTHIKIDEAKSWLRSEIWDYFNRMFHRACWLITDRQLPIDIEIVEGYADEVDFFTEDSRDSREKFRIKTSLSETVIVDRVIVSIGSQPNSLLFSGGAGKLGFFNSHFELTREKILAAFQRRGELIVLIPGLGLSALETVLVCEKIRQDLGISELYFFYYLVGEGSFDNLIDLIASDSVFKAGNNLVRPPFDLERAKETFEKLRNFEDLIGSDSLNNEDLKVTLLLAVALLADLRYPHDLRTKLLTAVSNVCKKLTWFESTSALCSEIFDVSTVRQWQNVISRVCLINGRVDPHQSEYYDDHFSLVGTTTDGDGFRVSGNILIPATGYSVGGLYPQNEKCVDIDPLVWSMIEAGILDYKIVIRHHRSVERHENCSGRSEYIEVDIPHPGTHQICSLCDSVYLVGSLASTPTDWHIPNFYRQAQEVASIILNNE
ncbi:MAG: FAD/NAD(P)-binding protein [Deltaproteobacteria bacterium]|nr:FAD/NAD(P)-binding protein [Deltaproteobacteria bacterium]